MSHHPHSQASDAAHHTTDNSEVNVYPACPLRDSTHRDWIALRPDPTSRARGGSGIRSRRPVGNRSISLRATVRNSSRDNRDASQRNQLHSHDANPNLYNRPRAHMSSEVDPPSQRGGMSQYSVDCSQDSASNADSQETGSTIPKSPLKGTRGRSTHDNLNGATNFGVDGKCHMDGEDFTNRNSARKNTFAIDQSGSIVPPGGMSMPRQGHPHIPEIGTQHASNHTFKYNGEKRLKRARSPDGEHETYAEERQRKMPCTSDSTTKPAYTSPEAPYQSLSAPDTSNNISNHPPDVDDSDANVNICMQVPKIAAQPEAALKAGSPRVQQNQQALVRVEAASPPVRSRQSFRNARHTQSQTSCGNDYPVVPDDSPSGNNWLFGPDKDPFAPPQVNSVKGNASCLQREQHNGFVPSCSNSKETLHDDGKAVEVNTPSGRRPTKSLYPDADDNSADSEGNSDDKTKSPEFDNNTVWIAESNEDNPYARYGGDERGNGACNVSTYNLDVFHDSRGGRTNLGDSFGSRRGSIGPLQTDFWHHGL